MSVADFKAMPFADYRKKYGWERFQQAHAADIDPLDAWNDAIQSFTLCVFTGEVDYVQSAIFCFFDDATYPDALRIAATGPHAAVMTAAVEQAIMVKRAASAPPAKKAKKRKV